MTLFQAFLSLVGPITMIFLLLFVLERSITSSDWGKGGIMIYGTIILVIPVFIVLIVAVPLQYFKWGMGFEHSIYINLGISFGWVFVCFLWNFVFIKILGR